MPTINLGPFGRFTWYREKDPEPLRPPSPVFIPTQYVDEVRIKRLNAAPLYRLARDLDDISDAPHLYSVAIDPDDCAGWDSLTRGSMMLGPRSPGPLLIPGAFSRGFSSPGYSPPERDPYVPYESPRVPDLKRWFIEIIAINLEADFDALKAALGPDKSNAWNQKDRDTRQEYDNNVCNNTVLSNGNRKFLELSSGCVYEAYQMIKHDHQPHPQAAHSVWLKFILPSREIDQDARTLSWIYWDGTPSIFLP
jgi:hypothetical protein